MSNSKRTISFSLDTEKQKQYMNEFAKRKGFHSASAMARYALLTYCNKFKDFEIQKEK